MKWPTQYSHGIFAGCLTVLLASTTLADTIEVPGDQPTIADAIAAAVAGDTILITDSATYIEPQLIIDKQLNIAAAEGQTPIIKPLFEAEDPFLRLNAGANGSQIGSNAGGHIVFDGDGVTRRLTRMLYLHPEAVTFENITLKNPEDGPVGEAILGWGAGNQGCGSLTMRDSVIDMMNRGQRAINLNFTDINAIYTFERVDVKNLKAGPGNEDGIIIGINSFNFQGGTLNLIDSRIEGYWRGIYIFQNPSKPQWTINITDSIIKASVNPNGTGIFSSSPVEFNIENSAIIGRAQAIHSFGQLNAPGDDGSIYNINESDIRSLNSIPIHFQPNPLGNRTLSVTNSIISTGGAASGIFVAELGPGDSMTGNHNNNSSAGYVNFVSTDDVDPAQVPSYRGGNVGNLSYFNAAFATASDLGGKIGTNRNFFPELLTPITIEVPGDVSGIAAAIAAAISGDTVLVTDSNTYLEPQIVVNKQVTLMASVGEEPLVKPNAPGLNPFLRLNAGSDGSQIGSNEGGRIIFDGDGTATRLCRALYLYPESVVLENITLRNPEDAFGEAILGWGAANGACGSLTVRDSLIDMMGKGQRAINLNFTHIDSVFTFERTDIFGIKSGPGNEDAFILGINAPADQGGTLNLIETRVDGHSWRGIYVFQNPAAPKWTINLTDSIIRARNNPAGVGVFSSSPLELNLVRSAIVSSNQSIYSFGNVNSPGDQGTSISIDESDIRSANTIPIQFEANPSGNRSLTVKNSILSTGGVANGVFIAALGPGDTTSGNNNNNATAGYFNFSSTSDVTPSEVPLYKDGNAGNLTYTNTTFLTAGESGGKIGTNFDFFPVDTPPPGLGDINGDEVVNVADVTALANALVAGDPLDPEVADVNGDTNIDSADVSALAALIVNPAP
jgi:hypothetical protein